MSTFKVVLIPADQSSTLFVFLLILCLLNLLFPSILGIAASAELHLKRVLVSASKERQCPCTFYVLAPIGGPRLDFVVSSPTSPRHQWHKREQVFYSTQYRDNLHNLHRIHVPSHRTTRLSVFAHRNTSLVRSFPSPSNSSSFPSFSTLKDAYVLPSTDRLSTCPVFLKPQPPHDYPNTQTNRIIGGLSINWELASYIVRFQTYALDDTGRPVLYYCSGTLISPQIAITAAHCNLTTSTEVVHIVRDGSGTKLLGMRNNVSSFHQHPSYDPTLTTGQNSKYDIAYVRLTYTSPSGASFMKINTNNDIPMAQSVVRVAGFGATVPTQIPNSDDFGFHQVDILVISNELCAYTHSRINVDLDSSRLLCAGNLYNRCGFCGGDSGGPLIQYNIDDEPVLIGVVSASVGCAVSTYPGIYVRISTYSDFIPVEDGITRTDSTSPKFVVDGNRVTDDPNLRETPSSMPTQTPLSTSIPTPVYSPLQSPLRTPAYSVANTPWLTLIPTVTTSPVHASASSPTTSIAISPILTAYPSQILTPSGTGILPLGSPSNNDGTSQNPQSGINSSPLSSRQLIIIIATLGVAVIAVAIIVIWMCVR